MQLTFFYCLCFAIIAAYLARLRTMSSSDPYDKCYVGMRWFHSHLRTKWTNIQANLAKPSPPKTILIRDIADFCSHLDGHHRIEEAHVFPLLAKKMPQFKHNAAHEKEHEVMHAALVKLAYHMRAVQQHETPWSTHEILGLTKTLEEALFPHLEAEEESLKGYNMRKAGFTLQELKAIPL